MDITTLFRQHYAELVRLAVLLAWGKNGWIDHGRLRLLPPQGGAAFTDAW